MPGVSLKKPNQNGNSRSVVKTLNKGLVLLNIISQAAEPLTLTELLELFPTDSGTLHRLLITLVKEKYLVQHYRTKRYSVGPRSLMLNQSFYRQNRIAENLRPSLKEISRMHPTTIASACVNSGLDAAILVIELQGGEQLPEGDNTGTELPLHATAHGLALLAFQPDELRAHILGNLQFRPHTPHSIVDKSRLLNRLEETQKQGWASENEEFRKYRNSIAAPILDPAGRAVASVGLHWHTGEPPTPPTIEAICSAARKIGQRLQQ